MTDAAAEIVNYYVYEPFGKALQKVETEENSFQFVGQLGVMEMGDDLIFMRNRFYAPSLGRFMAEDPIGLSGGDVSFYRYVQNDPINWVDPWGESSLLSGILNAGGNFAHPAGLGTGAMIGGVLGTGVGGLIGALAGSTMPGLGTGGLGFLGGMAGGVIGREIGGLFDPPYAGQPNYDEPIPYEEPKCE